MALALTKTYGDVAVAMVPVTVVPVSVPTLIVAPN
jgi:hypothetical protein